MTVLGDAAMDWLIRVPRLPSAGGSAWSTPPVASPGGTGSNVAVALHRLHVPVRLLTKVGADEAGRLLLDDLSSAGIDVSGVTIDASAYTPVVVAIVDGQGERTLISCALHSAQGQLRTSELGGSVSSAGWLHTSGILLAEAPSRETALAAMEEAGRAGATVSFDINLRVDGAPNDGLRAAVLAAVELAHVVFASEAEAIALCGSFQAVRTWAASAPATIIIRRGASGAVAVGSPVLSCAPPRTPVVDTVGAGDVFDAGYIAAALQQLDCSEALRWANAAAAVSIGRHGARSGPTGEELHSMLSRTPAAHEGWI